MSDISREQLQELLVPVTDFIGDRTLDAELEADLNREFPAAGKALGAIRQACQDAIAAGWMCKYEDGGIRFGRVLKPSTELGGFSVDVVHMHDVAGPHHRHPGGEIDLVMPLDETAEFDGQGEGWLVYAADSAHSPTVKNGAALVLYLLPGGEIEFSAA